MIDPSTAQATHDHDALGALAERRGDRQLGIGFVLVRASPLDRDAGRCERVECILPERIASDSGVVSA